jgi:CRISPR-associated endoribonuclease Cas6
MVIAQQVVASVLLVKRGRHTGWNEPIKRIARGQWKPSFCSALACNGSIVRCDAMLVSTVVSVQPQTELTIPVTVGKAVHACFLQMIRKIDAELAQELHDAARLKCFTTSPLQGPLLVKDRQIRLDPEQTYWLRFTSVESHLSTLLLALEQEGMPTLHLFGHDFIICSVTSRPTAHPWARRSTYEDIWARWIASESPPDRRVNLAFVSPTAFRSESRTIPLPLPRLVFSSLWERWNRYAPSSLDPKLLEAINAGVDISRYTLETHMLDFERYRQIGYVGTCEFLARKGVKDDVIRGMQLLVDFALYAGVGSKTTMGMGQTRRIS